MSDAGSVACRTRRSRFLPSTTPLAPSCAIVDAPFTNTIATSPAASVHASSSARGSSARNVVRNVVRNHVGTPVGFAAGFFAAVFATAFAPAQLAGGETRANAHSAATSPRTARSSMSLRSFASPSNSTPRSSSSSFAPGSSLASFAFGGFSPFATFTGRIGESFAPSSMMCSGHTRVSSPATSSPLSRSVQPNSAAIARHHSGTRTTTASVRGANVHRSVCTCCVLSRMS